MSQPQQSAAQGSSGAMYAPKSCLGWHRISYNNLSRTSFRKGSEMGINVMRFIFLAYGIWGWAHSWHGWGDWKYLTHLSYRFTCWYWLLSLIVAAAARYAGDGCCCGRGWNFGRKLQLIMFQICLFMEFVIILIYWGMLHDYTDTDPDYIYRNINVHFLLWVLLLIELLVTRVKTVAVHLLFVIGYSVLYLLYNMAYVLETGDYIYSIMKWNSFDTAVVMLEAVAGLVFAFFLHWGVEALRDKLCCPRGPEDDDSEQVPLDENDLEDPRTVEMVEQ